ncbi:glycosyltransferase family 4 protein [Ilumatobacter sp.]|uniref:glycosyltransferase family 4 protein n=1 Tax=Ilumatobacter sp. TaxID=1967498 RepID=UPI003B51A5F5
MPVVAIDAGPLHGRRTGVGEAVAGTLGALRDLDDDHDLVPRDDEALDAATDAEPIELAPYVVSMRARAIAPTHRRLPVPAAVAHRMWARASVPPMDRWLGNPDVVHGTNYVVPPARAPRIVSVYDCWFLEHLDEVDPAVRRSAAVLRRSVAEGAHVVTSSSATSARARSLLATERVHTVRLGPPPATEDPGRIPHTLTGVALDADTPFVLALGTLERRKNLTTLVRAFARLGAAHRRVHLVVAGSPGDDEEAIHAAVSRLDDHIRSRVHVIGPVDEGGKRWLLAQARALAYPSLDEGFGFPVLEAQRAGTPVVASTAGSIPEVAGPAALLSLPSDPDALAANLHWVVTDDERHRSLVALGERNLRRFSWQRTATELASLYRRVAEEG